MAGEEKAREAGGRGGGREEGREKERLCFAMDRLLFRKSKLIHPALPYPSSSPTRIFPSSSRVSRH